MNSNATGSWRVTALVVAALLALPGCDPGMTIRQTTETKSFDGHLNGLSIVVKEDEHLVGETWYSPYVSVTNHSHSPVTIRSVDLITGGGTYKNKPFSRRSYPADVAPGKTRTLEVYFRLKEDVYDTFCQRPAELRMQYRSRGNEAEATTSLTGTCPWLWRGFDRLRSN